MRDQVATYAGNRDGRNPSKVTSAPSGQLYRRARLSLTAPSSLWPPTLAQARLRTLQKREAFIYKFSCGWFQSLTVAEGVGSYTSIRGKIYIMQTLRRCTELTFGISLFLYIYNRFLIAVKINFKHNRLIYLWVY